MELKKHPIKDLEQYKSMLFNLGLTLSLSFVILAFEFKFYDDGALIELGAVADSFEEMLDIPITEQPPPPPPKTKIIQILEIPDEEEIEKEIEVDLDIEITEETEIEEIILAEEPEVEEADEILTIVEEKPAPKDGFPKFYEWISSIIKYPPVSRKLGIEGKVFVQFVVEKDGSLTNFTVIRGVSEDLDNEALRVLSQSPKWEPGKQRGRPVKVLTVMPIIFRLTD